MYTFRKRSKFWWFDYNWVIMFEESDVRTYYGSYEDVVEMVRLLNVAWELGYSSGFIQGQLHKS